ncbi:MAG: hypothetical protein P4L31_08345 [Candidatus Babeliales bacterium]|nr:hypothetical protein [Candidatus Babeliales bacterium]MDR3667651.1 hypothetical protein [Ignavibacteriaceae bacterium]
MKRNIRILIFSCLFFSFYACKTAPKNIPHYTISKEFKSDTLTTVDVHIANRLTTAQLLLIAGKLKTDSAQIKNLAIHFLLPGNTDISAGDNSYYAIIKYLADAQVKPTDSLKDDNGIALRLKLFGLDSAKAHTLLSQQPVLITGKNVLGKFVDDYAKTLIIPFKDPTDKRDQLFVIEVDGLGNIVSSTVPEKIVDGGVEKWMVDKNGDYITIKDSVLAQYPSNGLGLPFNSIRSGI